jgi:hypothetical protein
MLDKFCRPVPSYGFVGALASLKFDIFGVLAAFRETGFPCTHCENMSGQIDTDT